MDIPPGPLSSNALERIEAQVLDHLYTGLLFYKGFQEELPVPPA